MQRDSSSRAIDRKGSLVWDAQWESTHRTRYATGLPRRGQNANIPRRSTLKHERGRGPTCLLKCAKRPSSARTNVVRVKLATQQPTNGRPAQPLSYLRHHDLDSGLIRGEQVSRLGTKASGRLACPVGRSPARPLTGAGQTEATCRWTFFPAYRAAPREGRRLIGRRIAASTPAATPQR